MPNARMGLIERFHQLSHHRQDHILRVTAVVQRLAARHQLSPVAAAWAGYGHDLAREMARADLLREATRLEIRLDAVEIQEPILLHGPIAGRWVAQMLGPGSEDIEEAIRYHTTAGPHLGALAQALFIADGVEPGRQYPERAGLLALAMEDLAAGYRACLQHTADYLSHRGLKWHPQMAAALRESC